MKSDFDPDKAHESGDTLPEQANVYHPPRPLAQISDHRTIDFKAIRISAELDPRQAKTQLRLQAPAQHRRGLPLFVVGLAVVLALFGVAIYMELAREPLPLTTEAAPGPRAPAPEPTEARGTQSPVPAASQAVGAPSPTSGPAEPVTAAAAPNSATAPAAVPRTRTTGRSAPHKTKANREPWLE
jgi:hypothetical protein